MAEEQHSSAQKIEPRRGSIFDSHMDPLAINLDVPSIYSNPREIKDVEGVTEKLFNILDIDKDLLKDRLSRDKAFVWIKRKIDEKQADEVRDARLKGIYIVEESKRNYPNGKLASHIIGFAGIDNNGLEGLELQLDPYLKGEAGRRSFVRDAKQRTVFLDERGYVPPKNGSNIILTIDSVIQYIVEEELLAMVKKYNPDKASAIVMDPSSGKILAIANYPDYDLKVFNEARKEDIKNISISEMYEPGSVFKIVSASAVINENAVALDDKIYCEKGKYKIAGRVLHDSHGYGTLEFRDVIAKSSNIGTVKAVQKIGKKKFYDYIRRFGFGEKTGIGLPGESAGISRVPSKWARSDMTTIPIGQGIAVTPIQLVSAVSVIANGGYLMTPYVVDRIITWEGDVDKEFRPNVKRKVLKKETCDKMKDVLRRVVTHGSGKRARSKNCEICGKTGTAQMVNPEGGYFDRKFNATFIGFAPAEKPAISVVVTASNPHPAYYGGTVAAPAFKNIVERTLQYLDSNN
ncbi:MAG: penicillin-binding transpeptidase domain-containing protein [Candidatus Aadella gelida]|nr:penicillin-binding transpeptidase domain-containing protein [Candidatus Aadella gelida]